MDVSSTASLLPNRKRRGALLTFPTPPMFPRPVSHLLFAATLALLPLRSHSAVIAEFDAGKLPAGTLTEESTLPALGGFLATGPVEVSSRAGRQAAVFQSASHLIAEAPLSAEFCRGQAFTVEMWVLNPDVGAVETLLSIAPTRGGMGTEFSYGSSPTSGAFRSGFKATAAFRVLPAPQVWHHLAWTYDEKQDGLLKVYVDGELDGAKKLRPGFPAAAKLHLGASGELEDRGAKRAFTGAISQARVHDLALTQDELRAGAGLLAAYGPQPAEGSTTGSLNVPLKWESGCPQAATFQVFLGRDRAMVEGGEHPLAPPSPAHEHAPVPVEVGAQYYWRVAEYDTAGKLLSPGTVWQFRADPGEAGQPQPRDQYSNVSPTLDRLAWRPGAYATSQRVFLAQSQEELSAAKPLAEVGGAVAMLQLPQPARPGTRYWWRVDSTNTAPQPPTRGLVWTFRTQDTPVLNDVTFFVGSDCHYGRENNAAINRRVIDEMNALPGTPYPSAAGGGTVRTPRGVVLNGDLLDEGFNPETAPANWAEFCRDYGLTGEDGRLSFPVYEGFGNHDGGPTRSFVRAGVKERNPRRVGLAAISPNGLHYSWDWDHLHLVQLNLFGGSSPADVKGVNGPEHDPEQSLEFLRSDLAQRAGSATGKWVIPFQHFAWLGGMSDWWHPEAKERYYETISPYRVACLINGHSHGADVVRWHDYLTFHDGSTARGDSDTGDFLVVHATAAEVTIVQRKLGAWGAPRKVPLTKAAPSQEGAAK